MEIEQLVEKVITALMCENCTIGTAEECTAGLIGACLATDDYSQRWYKGSITAFTEEAVSRALEIPSYVITKNNLVSAQVASQMALNTMYKLNVGLAFGIVGYVDGFGSTDVPKGTIQMAIAKMSEKGVKFSCKKMVVNEDTRAKNIELCIKTALQFILETLEETEQ